MPPAPRRIHVRLADHSSSRCSQCSGSLIIRPQRAKQQKQRELLSSVEPGDEILTVGGIYGIVQEIEDEEDGEDLIVEIAEGIHVRVARRAVATVVKPDDRGRRRR